MGLLKPSNYLEFEFPCRGVGTYLCVVRPSERIRLAMKCTQVAPFYVVSDCMS